MSWAVLTGEYPPQPGGVADYTRQLALALARAGDRVHVFTSACRQPTPADPGVSVHRLPGHFGPAALVRLEGGLARLARPLRLLVQYVPHAYGWRAMNLPFCLWLAWRRRDPLWVMFHEVAFPVSRGQFWKHNLLGGIHRLMAALLARSASRVFVSIPAWEPLLRRLAPRLPSCTWLPVPSNLESVPAADEVASLRLQLAPQGQTQILGHFGTYGGHIIPLLRALLPVLLRGPSRRVAVLLGRHGDAFARDLEREHPALCGRLLAPGELPAPRITAYLAACDVLLQPFPDGVSSRRTSLMAGLALGLPIVTTEGRLSEPIWRERGAVALAPAGDPGAFAEQVELILARPELRAALAERARRLYQDTFSFEHTLTILRSAR